MNFLKLIMFPFSNIVNYLSFGFIFTFIKFNYGLMVYPQSLELLSQSGYVFLIYAIGFVISCLLWPLTIITAFFF